MPLDVKEEFLKLVAIDSPSLREGKLAAYLKGKLKSLGATVYEDDSAEQTGSDTGNIIAVYPGNSTKPAILLAAHMDTVQSTEGMVPQIRDGIIYSDGKSILGADDKAGIAVILGVLSSLQEDNSLDHGDVEVVFTVQEEVGLIGAKHLNYPFKAKCCYVLDGDGPVGTIINASPSHITLDLVIEGKAAHAGLAPESGINAIVVASEAISKAPSGRLDEETTSNYGMIKGGQGRNIVAEKVEVQAEVRSRNRNKLEKETAKILKAFEETAKKYQAKFSVRQNLAYEAFTIDEKQLVISLALEAGTILGTKVRLKPTGGGLDANIFNAKGIASVALGLGSYHPHSNTEYAIIDELENCRKFLLQILKQAAK